MERVNILLSTYNGERYIKEQLDSLLYQTYPNIVIYARDDGSSDNTVSILNEYSRKNQEKIILIEDDQNYGYPDCFWNLLVNCDIADFYSFCDQDDVWMPDKIERAVQYLQKEEQCALYIHDYEMCNSELKSLGVHHINNIQNLQGEQLIFYTIAQGFSMVINEKMRLLLLEQNPIKKSLPHDGWCIWNAFYKGKILYDSNILAYYRRHDSTVTSSGMGKKDMILSWLKKELFGKEMKSLEERAEYFLTYMGKNMKESDYKTWLLLITRHKTVHQYFQRLFYPKRLRSSYGGEVALRILFLLGK